MVTDTEEPIKEMLEKMYMLLGATPLKIHRERQIEVYLPRIDVFSVLPRAHKGYFKDTIFENLRPITCFEIHRRSLDELTFVKWYLELFGVYLLLSDDLKLDYRDCTGACFIDYVPEKVFSKIPCELIEVLDPRYKNKNGDKVNFTKDKVCAVKVKGIIPWVFIFSKHLRYDSYCFPANILYPDKHKQLLKDIIDKRYEIDEDMKKLAIQAIDWYSKKI